jgi:hypothetical protein
MNRYVDVCCLEQGRELSQQGTPPATIALLCQWRYLRQAALEQQYL